jgi:myo-inositol 2-dehydrogenase/D-chiro-inositol 1-dehydrogenase
MCGFSRRFDASYCEAWKKAQAGLIGQPTIFRSQTCDKYDAGGFFVHYSAMSGGIFVDMTIHDIDLSLWFFGEEATTPKSISAYGVTALHPELLKTNDRDNAVGIVEYYGGKIAYFYCSRMMAHGQEDSTDIIGTEGKLSVNATPQKDLVNFYHAGGITREVQDDFWERFERAFAQEINEFTDACLFDKQLPIKLETALKVGEIAAAMQEALVTGRQIHFTQEGERRERAQL